MKKSDDHILTLIASGELNTDTVSKFDNYVNTNITDNDHYVILDVSELEYLSSAGLRSMIILMKKLSAQNSKLIIYSPQEFVLRVLNVSGFAQLIHIAHNDEELQSLLENDSH
jgi:anti-anti-sigma factor